MAFYSRGPRVNSYVRKCGQLLIVGIGICAFQTFVFPFLPRHVTRTITIHDYCLDTVVLAILNII